MKRVNTYGNGDHYVHVKIIVPKKLSNEQKALIQVRFRENCKKKHCKPDKKSEWIPAKFSINSVLLPNSWKNKRKTH